MPTKKSTVRKFTDEELMQEAILEAKKSVPEHTDKTDPLVGAIIATPDGQILARAHRGELRIGEHCEYTLIERKLRDINLNGCVLYVTLEPCTDASRKIPKRGCCTHVVKARLARAFVGIEDPNPKIATEGIKFLMDNGVDVKMFPDHLERQIRQDNAKFIEEKDAEAVQAKKAKPLPPKSILEKPAPGATINSFSTPAIREFLKESKARFKYPSAEFNRWAEEFQFVERSADGNSVTPTGLGLMLFGTAPETQFPQTVFKVEIDYGNRQTELMDFKGPLLLQIGQILDFVRNKALKLTIERKGKRVVSEDFPFEVIREAISNAIIHRDYSIEGATNYLRVSSDKIVLRSPGGPVPPLTIDDLQSFDTPSLSRNPKIMFAFNQMNYAEQRGIGLRNMAQLPTEGFALPTFALKGGALELTFFREKGFSTLDPTLNNDLDKVHREIMLIVQKLGDVTVSFVAKELGIHTKIAQRKLKDLVDKRLLLAIGQNKGRRYILKSGPSQAKPKK